MIRPDHFPPPERRREQLEYLVRYAVLAPSGHNSQPWRFALRADGVEVLADSGRLLTVADPFQRELLISCGAALYHLRLAGVCLGLPLAVTPVLRDERLAAATVAPPPPPCPYWRPQFEAIPYRRTDRRRFSGDVSESSLKVLQNVLEPGFPIGFPAYAGPVRLLLIRDEEERTQVADRVEAAALEQWADRQYRQEVADWIRSNGRDGLTLGLPGWLSWFPRLVLRWTNPGKSLAHDDAGLVEEGPVIAVLSSDGDSRADWLATGECLAALLLSARAEGLNGSFFHQPLQLPAHRKQLAEHLGQPYPQVLLRLGRAMGTKPAPRRPVNELLEMDLSPES
ncbi:MAG: nitroreductase family protein [Candidatus Eremiobacterota bacterium]